MISFLSFFLSEGSFALEEQIGALYRQNVVCHALLRSKAREGEEKNKIKSNEKPDGAAPAASNPPELSSPEFENVVDSRLQSLEAENSALLAKLKVATAADPILAKAVSSTSDSPLSTRNGLVYISAQGIPLLYVPLDERKSLRFEVIARHHDGPECGHLGVSKTQEKISRSFTWRGLAADVKQFCDGCSTCQRTKRSTQKPLGNPAPFFAPSRRWEVVTMDECGGLPLTPSGNSKIWVFVDKLSKCIVAAARPEGNDADDIAHTYLDRVVQYYGLPRKIVSDRDPRLASVVFQAILRLWNVRSNMSTARHAQTDGQSEKAVEIITQLSRSFVNYNGANRDRMLPAMTFAYNDSLSQATGFTPFELTTGGHPMSPVSMWARDLAGEVNEGVREQTAAQFISQVNKNIARARIWLELARQRIEKEMSNRVRPGSFAVGQYVWLNYKAAGKAGEPLGKLRPQWLGPFKVTECRFSNAYRLAIPLNMRIHDVVNIRYLKAYVAPARGITEIQPARSQSRITHIREFRILVDAESWHILEFLVTAQPPDSALDMWLTAGQVVSSGGFELMHEFLASIKNLSSPANNFIGLRAYDTSDRNRSQEDKEAFVSGYDPLDPQFAYELTYRDGDARWISAADLQKFRAASQKGRSARLVVNATLPRPLRALVLFSGTNSVGLQLKALMPFGSTVTNLDIDMKAPDAIHTDLLNWKFRQFTSGHFDIIWASPPCTEYSVAKTVGVRDLGLADSLVLRTKKIIKYFQPRAWVIENPVGMLRHRGIMVDLREYRHTTSYCLYGTPFRKNTDLWCFPKPSVDLLPCSVSNPCIHLQTSGRHPMTAQLGPHKDTNTPGAQSRDVVNRVPAALINQLLGSFIKSLAYD